VLVAEYVTPTNPTADEVESLWNDFYTTRDAASASASAASASASAASASASASASAGPGPGPGPVARDKRPMCASDSDSEGPATPTRPLAV